jgi:hypothetical protein
VQRSNLGLYAPNLLLVTPSRGSRLCYTKTASLASELLHASRMELNGCLAIDID